MKSARLPILILAAVLLPTAFLAAQNPAPSASAPDSTGTEAQTDGSTPVKVTWLQYEQGMTKAKTEKKPIVIDFTASWCGWCKRMERDTFSNQEVIEYLTENFVPIKVWGDANTPTSHEGERMTERELAKLYGVRAFPVFWFLDADGERIGLIKGYKNPEQFLPLIKYVGGSHYKTMSYDSFLKMETGQG